MKSNHVWPAQELGLEAAIKPSRIAQVFLLGVAFTFTLPGQALAQTAPPPAMPAAGAGPVQPGGVPPTSPSDAAAPADAVASPDAPPAPAAAEPVAAPSVSVEPPAPSPKNSKIVERLEGGGWLGYGIQLDGQDAHPWGVTLGLRGGAVLPNHLYLGLMLGIFAGQSATDTSYSGYTLRESLWQSQVAIEGGYDLDFGPLTLRPYAGFGVNHTTVSVRVSSGFYSESADVADRTDAYLSVGGMGHIKLTDRIYGGLDSRFVVATTSPLGAAFVLAASGGVMFF